MSAVFRSNLLAISVLFAVTAGSAYAQSMYRCGKVFQDRPCENIQQGQVIGRVTPLSEATPSGQSSTSMSAAAGTATVDARCVQRGIAAQKIKWGRETGLDEQAQLSSAKTGAERQLISDVYQRQGGAPQIRAAVEADCIRENERRAQAAALNAAAAKLLEQDSPSPSSSSSYDVAPSEAVLRSASANSNRETGEKGNARRCADLRQRAEDVRSRQRVGGSASRMDSLSRERNAVDTRLAEEGC